jgi:Cu+-exporting ATPase
MRQLGIEPVIVTGDREIVARRVAAALDIREVWAGLLPADKTRVVEELKKRGVTGMAGDGINDAPALACADVSFAFATGADIAMEAADVTLMREDLNAVIDAVDLSRATSKKIRQNLFFAFVYNVIGIPLAAAGMLSPVIAGAAMAMSSVSVVSNSLLLKRWGRHRGRRSQTG